MLAEWAGDRFPRCESFRVPQAPTGCRELLTDMSRIWKQLGFLLTCMACAFAFGCSSNSGSQSVGPAVEYLYVGNSMGILPTSPTAGDAILAYSVDNSGNIGLLPGFPIALQFPPGVIVPDLRSRFLLVTGGTYGF